MDNLTHSMVGAVLGQMGLKRKSGLAMPTLIIAANIPDIDATCTIWGTLSLEMRRGLSHGPIAMLLLPLLLTGVMLAFDRWRRRRASDAYTPVSLGWLLVLAYVGTLSHPAMDWLNSYGIRLLEPFSSRWFYGDTLFIIDIWLWALLIGGFLLSRRQERRGRPDWNRAAIITFVGACAYIFGNSLITGHAEREAAKAIKIDMRAEPAMVVANPLPVAFWRRTILWRDEYRHGQGHYRLGQGVSLDKRFAPNGMDDPRIAQLRLKNANARAFLFWSRMPVATAEDHLLVLTDQRFADSPVARSFVVRAPLP